jgi:hypothetical protein
VKSLSKLISKLLQDAEDWNNDMRIQTAQLIYQFLHEIPDRKTELATVMEILTFQSGDQEAPVRNWVNKFNAIPPTLFVFRISNFSTI